MGKTVLVGGILQFRQDMGRTIFTPNRSRTCFPGFHYDDFVFRQGLWDMRTVGSYKRYVNENRFHKTLCDGLPCFFIGKVFRKGTNFSENGILKANSVTITDKGLYYDIPVGSISSEKLADGTRPIINGPAGVGTIVNEVKSRIAADYNPRFNDS